MATRPTVQDARLCGCRACGGPEARQEAIAQRRLETYAEEIRRRRGSDLANRVVTR